MFSLLFLLLSARDFDVELSPIVSNGTATCSSVSKPIKCSSLFVAIKCLIKEPSDTITCSLPHEYAFNDDCEMLKSLNIETFPTSILIKGTTSSNVTGRLYLPYSSLIAFDSSICLKNITFVPIICANSHSKCDLSSVKDAIFTIDQPIIKNCQIAQISFDVFLIDTTAMIYSVSKEIVIPNLSVIYKYEWKDINSNYQIQIAGELIPKNSYEDHKFQNHIQKCKFEILNRNNDLENSSELKNSTTIKETMCIEKKNNHAMDNNIQYKSDQSFCLSKSSVACNSVGIPYVRITSLGDLSNYELTTSSVYIQENFEFKLSDEIKCHENGFNLFFTCFGDKKIIISGTLVIPKCLHVSFDNPVKLSFSSDFKIEVEYTKYTKFPGTMTPIIQTIDNPSYKVLFKQISQNTSASIKYITTISLIKDTENVDNVQIEIEVPSFKFGDIYVGTTYHKVYNFELYVIITKGSANRIFLYQSKNVITNSYFLNFSKVLHVSKLKNIQEYAEFPDDIITVYIAEKLNFTRDDFPSTGRYNYTAYENEELQIYGTLYINENSTYYFPYNMFNAENLDVIIGVDPNNYNSTHNMTKCVFYSGIYYYKSNMIEFTSNVDHTFSMENLIISLWEHERYRVSTNLKNSDIYKMTRNSTLLRYDNKNYYIHDFNVILSDQINFCLIKEGSDETKCDNIDNLTIIHSIEEINKFDQKKYLIYVQENYKFNKEDRYLSFCSTDKIYDVELRSNSDVNISGVLNLPKCMHITFVDPNLHANNDLTISINEYDFVTKTPLIINRQINNFNINFSRLTSDDMENMGFFSLITALEDKTSSYHEVNEFIEINRTLNNLYVGSNAMKNDSSIIVIISKGIENEIHLFNQTIVEQNTSNCSLYLHISQFSRINEFRVSNDSILNIFSNYEIYSFSKSMMPTYGDFRFYSFEKPSINGEFYIISDMTIEVTGFHSNYLNVTYGILFNTSKILKKPLLCISNDIFGSSMNKHHVEYLSEITEEFNISNLILGTYHMESSFSTNIGSTKFTNAFKSTFMETKISNNPKFSYKYDLKVQYQENIDFCLVNNRNGYETKCRMNSDKLLVITSISDINRCPLNNHTLYIEDDYEFTENDAISKCKNGFNFKMTSSKRINIKGTFMMPYCMRLDLDDGQLKMPKDFLINIERYEYIYSFRSPIIKTKSDPTFRIILNDFVVRATERIPLVKDNLGSRVSKIEVTLVNKVKKGNGDKMSSASIQYGKGVINLSLIEGTKNYVSLYQSSPENFWKTSSKSSVLIDINHFKEITDYFDINSETDVTVTILENINFFDDAMPIVGYYFFTPYGYNSIDLNGSLVIHTNTTFASRSSNLRIRFSKVTIEIDSDIDRKLAIGKYSVENNNIDIIYNFVFLNKIDHAFKIQSFFKVTRKIPLDCFKSNIEATDIFLMDITETYLSNRYDYALDIHVRSDMKFCLIENKENIDSCNDNDANLVIYQLSDIYDYPSKNITIYIPSNYHFEYDNSTECIKDFNAKLVSAPDGVIHNTVYITGTFFIPLCMRITIDDINLKFSDDNFTFDIYSYKYSETPIIRTCQNPSYNIIFNKIKDEDMPKIDSFRTINLVKDGLAEIPKVNVKLAAGEKLMRYKDYYVGMNLNYTISKVILLISVGEEGSVQIYDKFPINLGNYLYSAALHISQFKKILNYNINRNLSAYSLYSSLEYIYFSRDLFPTTVNYYFREDFRLAGEIFLLNNMKATFQCSSSSYDIVYAISPKDYMKTGIIPQAEIINKNSKPNQIIELLDDVDEPFTIYGLFRSNANVISIKLKGNSTNIYRATLKKNSSNIYDVNIKYRTDVIINFCLIHDKTDPKGLCNDIKTSVIITTLNDLIKIPLHMNCKMFIQEDYEFDMVKDIFSSSEIFTLELTSTKNKSVTISGNLSTPINLQSLIINDVVLNLKNFSVHHNFNVNYYNKNSPCIRTMNDPTYNIWFNLTDASLEYTLPCHLERILMVKDDSGKISNAIPEISSNRFNFSAKIGFSYFCNISTIEIIAIKNDDFAVYVFDNLFPPHEIWCKFRAILHYSQFNHVADYFEKTNYPIKTVLNCSLEFSKENSMKRGRYKFESSEYRIKKCNFSGDLYINKDVVVEFPEVNRAITKDLNIIFELDPVETTFDQFLISYKNNVFKSMRVNFLSEVKSIFRIKGLIRLNSVNDVVKITSNINKSTSIFQSSVDYQTSSNWNYKLANIYSEYVDYINYCLINDKANEYLCDGMNYLVVITNLSEINNYQLSSNNIFIQENYEFSKDDVYQCNSFSSYYYRIMELNLTSTLLEPVNISGVLFVNKCWIVNIDDDKLRLIGNESEKFEIISTINSDYSERPIITTKNNPSYTLSFVTVKPLKSNNDNLFIREIVKDESLAREPSGKLNVELGEIPDKLLPTVNSEKYFGVSLSTKIKSSSIFLIIAEGHPRYFYIYNNSIDHLSNINKTYSVYLHVSQLKLVTNYSKNHFNIGIHEKTEFTRDTFPDGDLNIHKSKPIDIELYGIILMNNKRQINIEDSFDASSLDVEYEIDSSNIYNGYFLKSEFTPYFRSHYIKFTKEVDHSFEIKGIALLKTNNVVFHSNIDSINSNYSIKTTVRRREWNERITFYYDIIVVESKNSTIVTSLPGMPSSQIIRTTSNKLTQSKQIQTNDIPPSNEKTPQIRTQSKNQDMVTKTNAKSAHESSTRQHESPKQNEVDNNQNDGVFGSGLSVGAFAGIVAGCVVVLVVIVAVAVFFVIKKFSKRRYDEDDELGLSDDADDFYL